MDEKLENRLKSRWAKLENRLYQLTTILENLEEINEECEEVDVKSKIAYLLFEAEMKLIIGEQKFIESIWK